MVGDFDFSSYQSPIERVVDEVFNDFVKQDNDHLMAQVRIAVGYEINEDELIKALQYDRHQYEVGYTDGRFARDRELVRCKDCEHFTDSASFWMCGRGCLGKVTPWDYCSRAERRLENNDGDQNMRK